MTSPAPEWSYSGDPSSSTRDEVRFLLQDTDPAMQLMSDQELDYLIGKWMPLYESAHWVASAAASVVARKFAGVVSISADGVSVSVGDLSARYAELSKKLRQEHQEAANVGGTVSIENIMVDYELDPTIAPLNFGVGGHDNHRAGNQAFGGRQVQENGPFPTGGYGQP